MADVNSMTWPRKFDYGSPCCPYHSHLTCSIDEFLVVMIERQWVMRVVSVCGITEDVSRNDSDLETASQSTSEEGK